jgi:hypothetical protein
MEPVMEKFSQLETELEEILMQDKVGLYYAYIMCQTLLSNIRQAAEDLGWNESEGAYMPLPERTDPLPEKR